MGRWMLALALALAMLAGAVTAAGAAVQSPVITVAPAAGSQFLSFAVTGSGFTPGLALWVSFVSPDGDEVVYSDGRTPPVVTVGADGRFSVTIVPAVDFAGLRAGRWTVWVCGAESGECWSHEFRVLP